MCRQQPRQACTMGWHTKMMADKLRFSSGTSGIEPAFLLAATLHIPMCSMALRAILDLLISSRCPQSSNLQNSCGLKTDSLYFQSTTSQTNGINQGHSGMGSRAPSMGTEVGQINTEMVIIAKWPSQLVLLSLLQGRAHETEFRRPLSYERF